MIDLYTASTPNGWKASCTLEELGLRYAVHAIDLSKNQQKEPWFLVLNPNGRIPVIADRDAGDFLVFESGALMIYLAEKAGKLLPSDAKGRSRAIRTSRAGSSRCSTAASPRASGSRETSRGSGDGAHDLQMLHILPKGENVQHLQIVSPVPAMA